MAYQHQEYPKYLYHPKLAPKGKVFQSAEETKNLTNEGWVDTPAKFPKRGRRELSEVRDDFEAAEQEYQHWVSGGGCAPHSNKWEEITAKYQSARDSYDFALREAQVSAAHARPSPLGDRKTPETFETAFGTFKVQGVLGEGGTGRVFDVQDEDGISWAIKCLQPTALTRDRVKRFKNEIVFCSKNRHVNIVSVTDWGLVDIAGNRVPFYVMQRFPSTLRQQMRTGIEPDDVLLLFDQLLAGIETAHGMNVWHRDLKPENVLYDPSAKHLVIADFGIAHFAEAVLHTLVETSHRDRLANFQYAAPEQRAFGVVDHRADVYALGLILNEMFTGEVLQGTGHKSIGSVAPDFAYLDPVVDRMVRQSSAERPTSIAEIRAALADRTATPHAASGTPNLNPQEANRVSQADPMQAIGPNHNGNGGAKEITTDDVFERLKLYVFSAADARYPEAAHLKSNQLQTQFGLSVGYIEEFLEDLHQKDLICIAKWDGSRERPLQEWPSSQSFFQHNDDGGYIRVRMRRLGKQQLERLKARVAD